MGFLSGALSPLITSATQVGGQAAGAQVEANKMLIQRAIQQRAMQHQMNLENFMADRVANQTRNTNSLIGTRANGVTYKEDADGNLIALPKVGPTTEPTPQATPGGTAATSGSAPAPQGAPDTGGSGPASASASPIPVGPSPSKAGPSASIVPGVKMAVKQDPTVVHQKDRLFDVAHPVPQAPDRTLVQVQGADGTPVWMPRDQAAGQPAKVTTKVESAQNTAAAARLQAAVSEMNNAHKSMADYEAKLANGTANINGLDQLGGRVANSFTHDDPISMGIQSTALAALNRTNPDLARYIRRGLSFAEGESMISQRPSDFRTKMAAFLSTAASGASPEMIKDIQSRRTAILNPLNATVGASGGKGGTLPGSPAPSAAAPTAAPSPGQLWDAAAAKYGKAVVLTKFGPRPAQ